MTTKYNIGDICINRITSKIAGISSIEITSAHKLYILSDAGVEIGSFGSRDLEQLYNIYREV